MVRRCTEVWTRRSRERRRHGAKERLRPDEKREERFHNSGGASTDTGGPRLNAKQIGQPGENRWEAKRVKYVTISGISGSTETVDRSPPTEMLPAETNGISTTTSSPNSYIRNPLLHCVLLHPGRNAQEEN